MSPRRAATHASAAATANQSCVHARVRVHVRVRVRVNRARVRAAYLVALAATNESLGIMEHLCVGDVAILSILGKPAVIRDLPPCHPRTADAEHTRTSCPGMLGSVQLHVPPTVRRQAALRLAVEPKSMNSVACRVSSCASWLSLR